MTSDDARPADIPGRNGPRPGRHVPPTWLRRGLVVLAVVVASLVTGVVTARADLALGPHEALYEVTTDGLVTVDLGPLGTVELASPVPLGLGVRATVKEVPTDLEALGDRTTLDALEGDLEAYLQFFSGPAATVADVAEALVHDALVRAGLVAVGAASVLAGLGLLLGRPRRTEVLSRLAPHTVTIAGALVLALVAGTVANARTAPARHEGRPASAVFAGTALEGARITGRLSGVLETYGARLVEMYDDNAAYYDGVVERLDAAWLARAELDARDAALALAPASGAGDEVGPGDEAGPDGDPGADDVTGTDGDTVADGDTGTGDEARPAGTRDAEGATGADDAPDVDATDEAVEPDVVTFLQVSDLHCNIGMAPVIRRVAELAGASAILDTGDTTMNGTAVERVCVTTFVGAAPEGVAYVLTTGNHDSADTAEQARAAGATVLDGGVVDVAGLRILGDRDVAETRLGEGTAQAGDEDADSQGRRLAEAACEHEPDLLMVHTPRAGTAALASGCVPLQISGHLHRRIGPVRVGDGLRYVSGTTAGAAEGQLTIGPLRGTAQMTVWRFDRATGRMLDLRVVSASPAGEVEVGAAVRVPQLAIAPADVDDATEDEGPDPAVTDPAVTDPAATDPAATGGR